MPPIPDGWYRVEAPYFCAGLKIEAGVVTDTAPILSYMVAWRHPWTTDRLVAYCRTHNWSLSRLVPDLTGIHKEPIT